MPHSARGSAKRLFVGSRRRGEIESLDELACLLRAEVAIHAGIFPLDRQRPLVADVIESTNNRFPVDTTAAGRAWLPAAPRIAVGQIRTQQARPAIERDGQ